MCSKPLHAGALRTQYNFPILRALPAVTWLAKHTGTVFFVLHAPYGNNSGAGSWRWCVKLGELESFAPAKDRKARLLAHGGQRI